MKKGSTLRTIFGSYTILDQIGEGGCAIVYKATDTNGSAVAVKVLDPSKVTREKRKRFMNELLFGSKNKHPNIVTITDHGLADGDSPFFVMPLYDSSLRPLLKSISPSLALGVFDKIASGIDAAHKLKVIHRDIKPENILVNSDGTELVVADFGIAHFTEEDLHTAVETRESSRLANFQYASPEQRARGGTIDHKSDIYSLGLVLNELFTKVIPAGTNYATISSVSDPHGYIDDVVASMLQQNPSLRPASIEEIKRELIARGANSLTLQKISELKNTVIPVGEIDDPIADDPMRAVGGNWDGNTLHITLNHAPNPKWENAFRNMGNHTSVWGRGPDAFKFHGSVASVTAQEHEVQQIIDHFKNWLPQTQNKYESDLKREIKDQEDADRRKREKEIKRVMQRQSVNEKLTF